MASDVGLSEAIPAEGSRARLVSLARSEYGVFLIALGVVALHVVDDNFLQPERGMSAADHLVSGLAPLAVLALTAWAYPRLRAGARASIAITVGLLALAGGIGEGLYNTIEVGPKGDDYTGLLTVLAGLALVGLGAMTLWKTRKLDAPRWWRYLRRALIAVAALVVAFELVFAVGLSYVVTHSGRAVVPAAKLGVPYEEVTFRTSDGLQLVGWYVPSKNRTAVIAFPGRKGPQRQARMLARHGYGVLLFDRRGEGRSEGDANAFGWAGDRDLKAALAYLRTRPDVDSNRIGGIGLSVGGELMIETAAESDALAAVVSEGAGFRSTREHLELPAAAKWLLLPQSLMMTASTAIFSNHLPPPNLKDLVGRIAPRPVFLIYATNGQGGEELNPKYYAAAGEPKSIWEITKGQHTGGIDVMPAEYERRVIAFFDRALLAPS
jgi:uncharacterized protein